MVAVRNPLLPLLHPGTLSAAPPFRRRRVHPGAKLLAATLLGALVLRSFGFEAFNIPSGSMMPTLLAGDEVLVAKSAYGIGVWTGRPLWPSLPRRGEVIVFRPAQNPNADYIKRVVGLPGDRIRVEAGRLVVNGVAVPAERVGDFVEPGDDGGRRVPQLVETLPGAAAHPLLKQKDHGALDDTEEWLVPADHVFVMGDNRDLSEDSRSDGIGFVPVGNIVGRAVLRLYSLTDATPWWAVWRWPWALRPDRVLTRIE